MNKLILLSAVSFLTATIYAETDQKQQSNIKEKVLLKGKDYYDKRLQKQYEKDRQKKDRNSSSNIKIYRNKDGSINTFKTYSEAEKNK